MTPRGSVGDEDLPVAELLLIDDACDRFEAAWREGSEPQLAPFLAGASALARPRLFRELLTIDLEFRLGRGERLQPEAYRVGLPEDLEVIDEVFAAFGYGARPGDHLPALPGESPGPTLHHGRSTGRGPPPPSCRRDDPGALHLDLGARPEMVAAAPCAGDGPGRDRGGRDPPARGGLLLRRPAPGRTPRGRAGAQHHPEQSRGSRLRPPGQA